MIKASHALTAALVATIFGGILMDVTGYWWGQATASLWAWLVYLFLVVSTPATERKKLLICLTIATMGELFLGFVWGLYRYRLHNLPLFIPPGHAVVYTAGQRINRAMPVWLPQAVGAVMMPFAIAGLICGYDTQAPLWFAVFLFCLMVGPDRGFVATMFVFALVIETYGTRLGAWQYMPRDRWFGLTTVTTPPLWAGTYYCALDILVIRIADIRLSDLLRGAGGFSRRPVTSREALTIRA
jgi:hypothetical protein